MSSYLLYEPNHTFHVFIAAPDLQFQNFDPMGKMVKIVQNIKFSPAGKKNDSSLKLDLTRQHESRVCSIFKKETWMSKYWNFIQIETIIPTSKNMIFNESLFANFETTIRFVVSKRVRDWSPFLILSSDWPCTQNEANFNWQFS